MAKDVAFQLLPTNVMQTAVNATAQVVAAGLAAGTITDLDDAEVIFDAWVSKTFQLLNEQVEIDNKKLKDDFDAAPQKSYGNKGGGQKKPQTSAADTKFLGGKHEGETVAQVAESDPEYLEWYKNQTNPKMSFMKKIINEYYDNIQAGV